MWGCSSWGAGRVSGKTSGLETEPGLREGAWDQEEAPRLGRGTNGGGDPWSGEGAQIRRGLRDVKGVCIGGKVVGECGDNPAVGRGPGLGVGLRIREEALGTRARGGAPRVWREEDAQ